MGECFFCYWLTRVVQDKIQRVIKRLCGCVCYASELTKLSLLESYALPGLTHGLDAVFLTSSQLKKVNVSWNCV